MPKAKVYDLATERAKRLLLLIHGNRRGKPIPSYCEEDGQLDGSGRSRCIRSVNTKKLLVELGLPDNVPAFIEIVNCWILDAVRKDTRFTELRQHVLLSKRKTIKMSAFSRTALFIFSKPGKNQSRHSLLL